MTLPVSLTLVCSRRIQGKNLHLTAGNTYIRMCKDGQNGVKTIALNMQVQIKNKCERWMTNKTDIIPDAFF